MIIPQISPSSSSSSSSSSTHYRQSELHPLKFLEGILSMKPETAKGKKSVGDCFSFLLWGKNSMVRLGDAPFFWGYIWRIQSSVFRWVAFFITVSSVSVGGGRSVQWVISVGHFSGSVHWFSEEIFCQLSQIVEVSCKTHPAFRFSA
ncbi:hypothetical protein HYPBUDRAFT_205722 [Hyphopichia burtonii NRRL Y-1933]|uniref:Uncharacterized protein n=1 Tax=Hyphopichia burtonii NRRL Y-1933 TaxID=984485 RepID=A0A1E4RI53_9ASCO|nr:hypothetical protein HYPBUDRAFT_205722 [Hyphopichia burtonii NRRL Y-1933]ODV66933.1 hypothetical protein HYPBUDRAFT_205722 [Hyphopichia burtonii NRRL Y-1933]